jgi:hypothetical protein
MVDYSNLPQLRIITGVIGGIIAAFGIINTVFTHFIFTASPSLDISQNLNNSKVTITLSLGNTGFVPAHNLRLTFNSDSDIIDHSVGLTTEDIQFQKQYDPRRHYSI